MFTPGITSLATKVIQSLVSRGDTIVTAESCTGGLIAGALTSISGSSEAVYGGFVTYANDAKVSMIDVPEQTLIQHGAVSEQTVRAMADGALKRSGADIAIAVTGIAGPSGGSPEKPIGLVYLGCATGHETYHVEMKFGDLGRDGIREATIVAALRMVLDIERYA